MAKKLCACLLALLLVSGCTPEKNISPLSVPTDAVYGVDFDVTVSFTANRDEKNTVKHECHIGLNMDFSPASGSGGNNLCFDVRLNGITVKSDFVNNKIEYDSSLPSLKPMIFDNLVGAAFSLSADKNGNAPELYGYDAVAQNAGLQRQINADNEEYKNHAAEMIFDLLLNEESFKAYLMNVTGIFPDSAVAGEGDVWQKSVSYTHPLPFDVVTTYSYSGMSGDNILISAESVMNTPAEYEFETNIFQGILTDISASGSGKYFVFGDASLVQSGTVDNTINAVLIHDSDEIPIKISRKVVFAVNKK